MSNWFTPQGVKEGLVFSNHPFIDTPWWWFYYNATWGVYRLYHKEVKEELIKLELYEA